MAYAEYKYNKYKSKLHNLTGGLSDKEIERINSEIKTNIFNVSGATLAMRADRKYMLAAIIQNKHDLQYADAALRTNRLFIVVWILSIFILF